MNGRNYSIIGDSLSGGNIGECPTDPCALSPCMNGGTCTSDGNGRMFTCQCRFGFRGETCSNGKYASYELNLLHLFSSDHHRCGVLHWQFLHLLPQSQ